MWLDGLLHGVTSELLFWNVEDTAQETERFFVKVAFLQHLVFDALQTVIGFNGLPVFYRPVHQHPPDDEAGLFRPIDPIVIRIPKDDS